MKKFKLPSFKKATKSNFKKNKLKFRFANLEISKKLISSFLIISIISTVIGMVGITGMLTISKKDSSLYKEQTEPLIYLSYMLNSLNDMQIQIREGIISSGKLSAIEASEKAFNEQMVIFKSSSEAYKANYF